VSGAKSAWSLPDEALEEDAAAEREIRISDFALLALLPVRSVSVQGLPVNELAMAALIGLCLFRPARGKARLPGVAVLLLTALLALLTFSGMANNGEADWTRRVGHVAISAGLIWAGGTGRIHVRSAGAGLAAGLAGVVTLALFDVGGDYYSGRLTGYLADPNAGAFFLVVLGLLAIFFSDDRWWVRLPIAVPIIAGLILTYSRTGLLAAAFAFAWLAVGRRLGVASGIAAAVAAVWLVNSIPETLTTVGPFSDRSGSDALRKRIIAQEYVELSDMPWYGNGPGTARVRVRDLDFFFHNSYLATRQEGGWVALLLILGLLLFTFMRLFRQAHGGDVTAAAAQAALVATAVMAITLGEVLLDTPTAVAVGLALGYSRQVARSEPPDG
jgi:O-antigen ligase